MKDELLIALKAAIEAGKEILDVYSRPVSVELKEDRSPLTEADKRAHICISNALSITPYPILSEEGRTIPYSERKDWKTFWLVDPLDGTKEFIKRNDEFTVNIALIHNQEPVAGIVLAPATDQLYFSIPDQGSFRFLNVTKRLSNSDSATLEDFLALSERLPLGTKGRMYTVVASRSHLSPETSAFVDALRTTHGKIDIISSGSSLKLCLVAEGSADVYPRFAPTMEWDTAAGHAVIRGMGKTVVNPANHQELLYNKEDLLNPWFIAG